MRFWPPSVQEADGNMEGCDGSEDWRRPKSSEQTSSKMMRKRIALGKSWFFFVPYILTNSPFKVWCFFLKCKEVKPLACDST